jgi:hypothetical protein
MKLHRSLYGNLAPWLVLALSVNSAIAGTPGPCSDTTGTWCGSGGVCTIKVSEATGTTTVDNPAVEVKSDTRIEWSTTSGRFTVTFRAPHPFPNTPSGKFNGAPGHNSGDKATIAHTSPPACYQYSVEHCNGSGVCATIDPKVIVTNVRDGH